MRLIAYVDGGGEFEKRHAGIGVVIIEPDSGEVIWARGFDIGSATNNEAEYSAVIQCLYQAEMFGATELLVHSDSKLIVNQINGDWQIHENHLKDYYDEVKSEVAKLDKFEIKWVPRSQNQMADGLARRVVES